MPNENSNNNSNRTDLIDLAWMDEYDAGLKGALASIVQDYTGRLQQCVQQATGMGLSHNDLTDQLLQKLNGLQNYDDTAVRALVSGIRTDLAGYYTKLETYSQAEVNQLISLIPKFGIVVIPAGDSLPLTVGDQEDAGYDPEDIEAPAGDKLYLVGDANAQSPNMYTEYIYVEEDDDYEMLGTQQLNLSGYSTTAEMNTAIAAAVASMPTMSDTAITSSTIGQKQFFVGEKVNGKYVLQPFSPADLKQMVYDYMASANVASAFASVLGVPPFDSVYWVRPYGGGFALHRHDATAASSADIGVGFFEDGHLIVVSFVETVLKYSSTTFTNSYPGSIPAQLTNGKTCRELTEAHAAAINEGVNCAAGYCLAYQASGDVQRAWALPGIREWLAISKRIREINKALQRKGAPILDYSYYYWTANAYGSSQVWYNRSFTIFDWNSNNYAQVYAVRPVLVI